MPTLLLKSPDATLTPVTAMIPLVNVALTFRDAITGSVKLPLVALTAATQLAAIAVCVLIAARMTRFEDVIAGPSQGGIFKAIVSRVKRRARPKNANEDAR